MLPVGQVAYLSASVKCWTSPGRHPSPRPGLRRPGRHRSGPRTLGCCSPPRLLLAVLGNTVGGGLLVDAGRDHGATRSLSAVRPPQRTRVRPRARPRHPDPLGARGDRPTLAVDTPAQRPPLHSRGHAGPPRSRRDCSRATATSPLTWPTGGPPRPTHGTLAAAPLRPRLDRHATSGA